MGSVVKRAEGGFPYINVISASARAYLVARLFTDAVFNQDIRAMQLIIGRIDGAPKNDEDMGSYVTEFTDALNAVLDIDDGSKLVVTPQDSVMTAMCKSLVDLACMDIYGMARARGHKKPSTEQKQDRDNAMRIVLERSAGKRTTPIAKPEPKEAPKLADWIAKSMEDVV